MGYGVFATKTIPKGTITWVGDPLDQILSPERYVALPAPLRALALKYSYLNGRGERVLCWDHARFINHSCAANCLSPGFDFEVATCDINAGDEITDDYGTLNLEEPFPCFCSSSHCRGSVLADDPIRYADEWDALTASAFPLITKVEQPLWELVGDKMAVGKVLRGEIALPSVLAHYRGQSLSRSRR